MKRGDTTKGDYTSDKRVAQYLSRASRGLWGKERDRLRDELSIHLDGLINSYRMAGVSKDDAIETALEEMGPATKVSVGMARLHTLPLMTVMGLLACSVVALTLMFAPTVAQSLNALNSFPVEECMADVEAAPYCKGSDWVNMDELANLLEEQGIGVNKVGDNVFLIVPGYDKALLSALSQTHTFFWHGGEASGVTRSTKTGYVKIRSLLEALGRAGIPVRLEGWDDLKFSIADKTFALTFGEDYSAQDFYEATFYQTLTHIAPRPADSYTTVARDGLSTQPYRFAIDAQVGEVFGVFGNLNAKTFAALEEMDHEHSKDTAAFYFDIARVEEDGVLVLELPDTDISFQSSPETVRMNGDIVLLRLTGEVNGDLYTAILAE